MATRPEVAAARAEPTVAGTEPVVARATDAGAAVAADGLASAMAGATMAATAGSHRLPRRDARLMYGKALWACPNNLVIAATSTG
jgi:hypothetical protein